MDLKKPTLLLSLALTLSIGVLYPSLLFNLGDSKAEPALLVIGVLSAQNNSAARYSIRNTWKTLIEKPFLKFYFLIGKDFCPIHPVDRKSELSCEPMVLAESYEKTFSRSSWTPDTKINGMKVAAEFTVTSFTFHVNFPVIIRGLRVQKTALQSSDMAIVNVKNARSGDVVTSLTFQSSKYFSEDENDWLEARPNSFLLPKSFDAELQFLAVNKQNETNSERQKIPCYGISSWFNFSGGIEFTTQFGPDSGWLKFNGNACAPVSLLLELHDLDSHMGQRQARNQEWQKQISSLSERLRAESNVERDILFVDVLDVYNNIPMKLLKFYEWIHKNENFLFVLKADDDTFINISVIEHYLKSLLTSDEDAQRLSGLWWWGKLRFGLPVERHGKWQELDYAAPVYPPFPCGGGYIINKSIVEFLVTSSKWLRLFQGEDTSLGIWLSAMRSHTPKDAMCHWSCGQECDVLSCNRGQLSVSEMFSVWQTYQKTKRLC